MKLFFDDPSFDGQLQRSVGMADSGMANVGECLAIAAQVEPDDRGSWLAAWSGFAERLARRADEALAAGHRVTARGRYLRAAEYYRQASFFHREDLNGAPLRQSYAGATKAFRAALGLLDHPARALTDPFPGYLHLPAEGAGPFPLILHLGGYDGTAEELFASAHHALARGFAFAAIDGPGQGATLYERGEPMRPDWENVVPSMFDALAAEPEIDAGRIVLLGRSFGGYLAPRGAAGERRLAAMVVDPGQFDIGAAIVGRLGSLGERLEDPVADADFEALLENPRMRELLAPRMAAHGISGVREYCLDLTRYTNAESVAGVTCPTLVTDNETDLVSTGQGKVLYEHLDCPKEFRLFKREEGAEGHCEGMAPIVFWDAAFDWLDSVL
ncbi:MAG: alpha/beta fold hydrolase [Actinobacteria bacterium]|nr:alpha/beta fold hydrolase [Actinomycetota bacterium]